MEYRAFVRAVSRRRVAIPLSVSDILFRSCSPPPVAQFPLRETRVGTAELSDDRRKVALLRFIIRLIGLTCSMGNKTIPTVLELWDFERMRNYCFFNPLFSFLIFIRTGYKMLYPYKALLLSCIFNSEYISSQRSNSNIYDPKFPLEYFPRREE